MKTHVMREENVNHIHSMKFYCTKTNIDNRVFPILVLNLAELDELD